MILPTLGRAIFLKSNHVGRHFCTDIAKGFRYFAQIFMDFAWIFRDFARFSPNQNFHVFVCFRGGLASTAPPLPTPLKLAVDMMYCIRSSLPHATR